MQTKSNIQLVRENLAIKESFKQRLIDLMNDYIIEDSYFNISTGEWSNGYFVVEHEYASIDDAINNMTNDQTIRIIENKRFQIGKRYGKLSELSVENDRKIIDITSGVVVCE